MVEAPVRYLVEIFHGQAVPRVERRIAIRHIKIARNDVPGLEARPVVQCMSVGVRRAQLQAMRQRLLDGCLERVVLRVQKRGLLTDRRENRRIIDRADTWEEKLNRLVGRATSRGQASGCAIRIKLVHPLKPPSLRANVAKRSEYRRRELILHAQLSIQHILRVEIRVDDIQREWLEEPEIHG